MNIMGKIRLNTIHPNSGLKYMYMRPCGKYSSWTTYSNSKWYLRWLKLKDIFNGWKRIKI